MPTISEVLQDLSWGPRYPRWLRAPTREVPDRSDTGAAKALTVAEAICMPMLIEVVRGQPLWRQTPPPANLAEWLSTDLPPETPRPPPFPRPPTRAYANEFDLNLHWATVCSTCKKFLDETLPIPKGATLEGEFQGQVNGTRDAPVGVRVAIFHYAPSADPGVLPEASPSKSAALIQVKREPVLEGKNLDGLEEVINSGDLNWLDPCDSRHTNGVPQGQRTWLQIYNQLMGYNLTAGIVAGDNAIFLVERQTEVVEDDVTGTCKTIGKLIVDGPLYMYPGVGQERFTPAMLYAYLGWATLDLLYRMRFEPPELSPLLVLQDYWRERRASNTLSWLRCTSALATCFAQWQLAYCTSLEVVLPSGLQLRRCIRVGPPLVIPPSISGWISSAASRFVQYAPAVRLRVDSVAGKGASCLTLRGVHLGVPFVLKFDRSGQRSVAVEWEQLQSLDVVRTGSAGTLPIPFYYGMFDSSMGQFSILSDNGIDLQWGEVDLDMVRPLVGAAFQQLHDNGIEPTDVADRNVLWDGEHITIVDFVDPTQ